MNIKKSIACMALMISTGYSSLMSPEEFKDNLNKVMNNPTYSFKGMESQEPGLNKSREYYRVVERFVADQFNDNKELLSLSIAAGKFGINTEFMWTLYNMASMGALRVEENRFYEREKINNNTSSVHSRKNSEDESEEEKPAIKVVAPEQKPKEFSKKVTEILNKCNEVIKSDEKVSFFLRPVTELSTFLGKLSDEELRSLTTEEDFLKKSFKDNSGNALSDTNLKDILKKTKAILFLRDPIETELNKGYFDIAKGIAEKVKDKPSGDFYRLLETFTRKELSLALSDNYKNAFVNCGLYTINYGNTPAYRESILKNFLNTYYPLRESDFKKIVFNPIKALAFLTYPIPEDFKDNPDDFETAKGIAEKVKAKKSGRFSYLLETFTHKELLLALSDEYKRVFVNCGLYKDDKNGGLDLNDFSNEENLPVKKIKAKAFLTDPIETDFNGNPDEFETAKGIAEKVKKKQSGRFSYLLETFTHKELLLALTDNYKRVFVNCDLYDDDIAAECYKSYYTINMNYFDREIIKKIKARALLTYPDLEKFKDPQLEIVKKIAEKMKNTDQLLQTELGSWDSDMVEFIAKDEEYKDAIIKYSKAYEKLQRASYSQEIVGLTPKTFDEIVVSALIRKANDKKTLDEIKQNFSTVIENNKELKNAIEDKEKTYNAMSLFD